MKHNKPDLNKIRKMFEMDNKTASCFALAIVISSVGAFMFIVLLASGVLTTAA